MGWYGDAENEMDINVGIVQITFTCPSCLKRQTVSIDPNDNTEFECNSCNKLRAEIDIRFHASYRR